MQIVWSVHCSWGASPSSRPVRQRQTRQGFPRLAMPVLPKMPKVYQHAMAHARPSIDPAGGESDWCPASWHSNQNLGIWLPTFASKSKRTQKELQNAENDRLWAKGQWGTLMIPDFRNSKDEYVWSRGATFTYSFLFWMWISACATWNEIYFEVLQFAVAAVWPLGGFVRILYRVSEKGTWSWTRFRLVWPGTVEEMHKFSKSCRSCI